MNWLHHKHKVPKGPIKRLPANELGVSNDAHETKAVVEEDEKDYIEEFEKWPPATYLKEYEVLEFEWEGFGHMFLGLTIVNKYDRKGILVKKVDPEGAGGKYGVQPGDYFVGIGGRQIPHNLPDGEVAKIFHALPMPIKLSFTRVPVESADTVLDWQGLRAPGAPPSPALTLRKGRSVKASPVSFKEGDLVTFYRDSTAFHGAVQAVHGVGNSAVADVLLPLSGSLVQGVPVGRLDYRLENYSPKTMTLLEQQTRQLKLQQARGSQGINEPSPRGQAVSPKTDRAFLRMPSGSKALAGNATSKPSKASQPAQPRLVEHFDPFGDDSSSLGGGGVPATFDPFSSPRNLPSGGKTDSYFDAFEVRTQDAETVSNASYDFNASPPLPPAPPPSNPFDVFSPKGNVAGSGSAGASPSLNSAKLARSLSRSMSNQGLNSPAMRSPNNGATNRSLSRQDSKNMFLTAFDLDGNVDPSKVLAPPSASKPPPPPPSTSAQGTMGSPKFYVKGNEGRLQRSSSRNLDNKASFNPFSP